MTIITRSESGLKPPKNRVVGSLSAESTAHWNGQKVTVGGSSTWDHSRCASLVRGIQSFHMNSRGWSDIAYNFVICPHGYVFEGRGLNIVNGANGTNSGNRSSHAVMCLGGEGNDFGAAEKAGFRDCILYISENTFAPETCKGHRDHKPTACPGDERYNWVHKGMPINNTNPSPQPKPKEPKHKEKDMLQVIVNGNVWLLGLGKPINLGGISSVHDGLNKLNIPVLTGEPEDQDELKTFVDRAKQAAV